MSIFDKWFGSPEEEPTPTTISDVAVWEEEDNFDEREIYAQTNYTPLAVINYDGEKNPGEIGTINQYVINHYRLAKRAWQSFLESEVTQTLVHKYVRWVIGKGLRLRAEPDTVIIDRGDFDEKRFSDIVERRWKLWSKSKLVDYRRRDNLAAIQKEAYKNAIINGDVLVVLRIRQRKLTVQLIDGDMVVTPPEKSLDVLRTEGNRVINGIEINNRGEHVAFYVKNGLKYDRILARGSRSGRLMAYMVYGRKYRIRDQRGISIYAAILEKLAKLDRYTEATVASAEEAAKIAWYITHLGEGATGEDILQNRVRDDLGMNPGVQKSDKDIYHNSTTIARTSEKMVYNLKVGSDLKKLTGGQEIHFKDFYPSFFNALCGALDMPPEVAMSKYETSFSSARAALQDWKITLEVERERFAHSFLKPIYALWIENQVIGGVVSAPGFIAAASGNDEIRFEAYMNCTFTGVAIPHIDPVKEIQALRLKLGKDADNIPMIDYSEAMELASGLDFEATMQKIIDQRPDIPEELLSANQPQQEPAEGDDEE